MLRIGQVEATATQDGKYTDGSVAGGIAATRLRAAAFNAMQEELAHIVESAGLALDINDMTQVLKAIQKLTLSRANPFADIKSDGAVAVALANLGLGDGTGRLINVKTFTSSGTYTPTAGTKFVVVEVQGGGGGSGGVPATGSTSVAASGAGGAGAYAKAYITSGFSSVSVTVGAGGAAGSSSGSDGGTGGTSSFGSLVTCPGGTGGGSTGSVAVSFPTSRGGSTETAAPTGGNIISSKGKAGSGSTVVNGTVGNFGTGAASQFSAGGAGGDGENGSGGGGWINFVSQSARPGYVGGKGLVVVWEYA